MTYRHTDIQTYIHTDIHTYRKWLLNVLSDVKISESGIHIYWKTLDGFLLNFKRIFETACSVNGIGFVNYKPIYYTYM